LKSIIYATVSDLDVDLGLRHMAYCCVSLMNKISLKWERHCGQSCMDGHDLEEST